MKTSRRIVLIAAGLLISRIGLTAQEFRIGIDYKRMLPAKLEFTSKLQLRSILGPQNTYYAILQVGMKYEVVENLTVAGTFRYALTPVGKSENLLKSLDEKRRYTAGVAYKFPRFDKGIRLSYRLRYQHSAIDEDQCNNYLRNRLKADYKLTKDFRPYTAIESYYRLGKNEMNKLRLYLGSEIEILRTEIELGYILELKLHGKDSYTSHMIGLFCNL